jgi:hypothetical protein
MYSKDYIPKPDRGLLDWLKFLIAYAMLHCARWKVEKPSDDFVALLNDFEAAVLKTMEPNHGKVDVVKKNDLKKAVVKEARTYVQGFLAKNPHVTNADREEMKLPIYDVIHTPVGNPVGLVTATFKYPNECALELNILHVKGSPYDEKANYGVRIESGVFAVDAPPVTEVNQLHESRFIRRKKELFTFDKKDARKIAYFCLRYENSKGQAGQWGPIVSAIIP